MSKTRSLPEVSPKGVFVYPCLNRPDTKFDEAGVYSVKLRLSAEEAQPLVDMIDKAIDAQVEKVKASGEVKGKVKRADPPYSVDEETGEVTINFKMKASGVSKDGKPFTQEPALKCTKRIDGKPTLVDMPGDQVIGGGTIGKVSFALIPFFTKLVGAGVSLRLRGVLVSKLVKPSYSCGFEADEDDCMDENEFLEVEDRGDNGDGSGYADASAADEDASGADF